MVGTRVVLDTTVYVSAAITGGAGNRIVRAFLDQGAFKAVVSPKLLEELRGVLLRPRFGFSQGPVDQYLTALYFNAEVVMDVADPPSRCKDPEDDYLIEVALEAGAAAIVSDNWDLLEVSPIEGKIPVLNSASLLRLLREAGLED